MSILSVLLVGLQHQMGSARSTSFSCCRQVTHDTPSVSRQNIAAGLLLNKGVLSTSVLIAPFVQVNLFKGVASTCTTPMHRPNLCIEREGECQNDTMRGQYSIVADGDNGPQGTKTFVEARPPARS